MTVIKTTLIKTTLKYKENKSMRVAFYPPSSLSLRPISGLTPADWKPRIPPHNHAPVVVVVVVVFVVNLESWIVGDPKNR